MRITPAMQGYRNAFVEWANGWTKQREFENLSIPQVRFIQSCCSAYHGVLHDISDAVRRRSLMGLSHRVAFSGVAPLWRPRAVSPLKTVLCAIGVPRGTPIGTPARCFPPANCIRP